MNGRSRPKSGVTNWIERIAVIPKQTIEYLQGKAENLRISVNMRRHAHTLTVSQQTLRSIEKTLSLQLKKNGNPVALHHAAPYASPHPAPHVLNHAERDLFNRIREETRRQNRNNITRTAAYFQVYRQYPELHWAFLAHMVSRNGGWSMTDLKGELLSKLLREEQQEHLFSFLERANALIFQDAYPQLLLYAESRKQDRNLFHLLPHFHVSKFMKPFWNEFWRQRDSVLLTVALIVNEQHYIERRVVQQEPYKSNVLDTWFFKAQSILQLNQVVLPYWPKKINRDTDTQGGAGGESLRLAGLALENFSELSERIEAGKKLYAMLFAIAQIRSGAEKFANARSHTASRSDYWPQLFSGLLQKPTAESFHERLDGCKLLPGAAPLYSPKLSDAWPDRPVLEPERFDWFHNLSPLTYFRNIRPPMAVEMTNEYCFGLNKIELAALAGEQLK